MSSRQRANASPVCHTLLYGTTDEQLGAVAVAFRKHACLNPNAVMQKPLTIED